MAAAFARTLEFSDAHIITEPCAPLDPPLMRLYEDVTHHAFQAPSRLPAGRGIQISAEILAQYQWAVPRLAVVAGLGYLASLLALVWSREAALVVPSTVILVAVGVRFVLLSAADVVATVPYAPRYYQPLFPLLLLFIGLNTYTFLQLARRSMRTAVQVAWHRYGVRPPAGGRR